MSVNSQCCLLRLEEIEHMWQELQRKLEVCRNSLSSYHDLMAVFAEMDDCLQEMAQIEVSSYTP